MPKLKRSQLRAIERAFGMESGYVLDFSNRTFEEWFFDESGVEIYDEKYAEHGSSKANRLRCFLQVEDASVAVRVLDRLWSYGVVEHQIDAEDMKIAEPFQQLLDELRGAPTAVAAVPLSDIADVLNLDTVARDLARAMEGAKTDPEDAVTAACSTVESVLRSIITELGLPLPPKKDVKSLYSKVRDPLGLNPGNMEVDDLITDDVRKVLSGLGTVVEGIGALRTHGGDAHGRERGYKRLDARIAALAINAANTVALFLIETWQRKYPSRELHQPDFD